MPLAISRPDVARLQGHNLRARPLDGLPLPTIAYSLRLLHSGWAGNPLCQVALENDTWHANLYPGPNGWIDYSGAYALIEKALDLSISPTVYLRTIYEQMGTGRHATSTSTNAGNRPAIMLLSGNPIRLPSGQPAMMAGSLQTAHLLAGGSYYLCPPGKRWAFHAVIAHATGDYSTGNIPPGLVMMGNDWLGGALGASNTIIGYAGLPSGNAFWDKSVLYDGASRAQGGVMWPQDKTQIVSTRRYADTLLAAWRNGVQEDGAVTVANTSSTLSAVGLLNMGGGAQLNRDGIRCSEIVHYQYDPGADWQRRIYEAAAADFAEAT